MQQVHFIGIGGIGMSALASIMMAKGTKISGSDSGGGNSLTQELEVQGAVITYEHKAENIPEGCDLVVYTEAIPKDNPELVAAKAQCTKMETYAQALGNLSKNYKTVVVSGTHGKTTVTGMIAKMAMDNGLDPTIVIGSKMKELDGKNYRIGQTELFILEGCEYRRSFLNFSPDILVITNVELDHLDYFKDEADYFLAFKELIAKVPGEGRIVLNEEDANSVKIVEGSQNAMSIDQNTKFQMILPGEHNRTNAKMAFKVGELLGLEPAASMKSLNSFSGTWRRLELVGESKGRPVYDDYGHHPTEIKATLQALKEKYPDKKICAVFQPHQYSRTKHFLKEFAESFELADTVLITYIYAARDSTADKEGVSADDLVKELIKNGKDSVCSGNLKDTALYLKNMQFDGDVIILMGAGDITKIRNGLVD